MNLRKTLLTVLAAGSLLAVASPTVAAQAVEGQAVEARAAEAQAEGALDAGAQADPVGVYRLTIRPEAQAGAEYGVTLRCGPDGGGHDRASAACGQLRKVDGEVRLLDAKQGNCTLQYAPVQVTAEGHWRGEPRHYAQSYLNKCQAILQTGGVLFDF